jgi:2,5-diketo-D-gluconate reductase B
MKEHSHSIPLIGLGTWRLTGDLCFSTVKQALDLGYRHIDTAVSYGNHKEIGLAIKGVKREELYLTSKIPIESVDFSDIQLSVEKICDSALLDLQTDYVDLLLIHSPDHEMPMQEMIFAMEKLRDKGKIKYLGVSNFTMHHIENLLSHEAYISVNQVEFHPYLFQKELLHYCIERHIRLVAYRPFGKGELLSDPLFSYIGKRVNKSPAQIILRWLVQRGIPAIPKASSIDHLRANLDVFDFMLTEEEMGKIDALHRNIRYCMKDFAEFSY